jgi:hypothetical protein
MQYLVACNHCGHPVVTTGQLAVADWREMRTHLMTCAQRSIKSVPDALGDLLTHFRVQRVPDQNTLH